MVKQQTLRPILNKQKTPFKKLLSLVKYFGLSQKRLAVIWSKNSHCQAQPHPQLQFWLRLAGLIFLGGHHLYINFCLSVPLSVRLSFRLSVQSCAFLPCAFLRPPHTLCISSSTPLPLFLFHFLLSEMCILNVIRNRAGLK